MWAPCAPFHSHKSHLEFFFLPSPVEQRFSASFRMHIPSWHAHVPAESLRSNLETNSATHSLCQWCCRVESGVETQDFKDSRILKSPEKKREDFATRVFVLFFFGGGGDKVSSYKWVTGVITTLLVGVKPTYNWIRGPPCGVSVIFLPRFSILQNLPNAFSYMTFFLVSVMFVPLLFLFRSGAFFNLLQPNSWKQTTGGGNDQ